jgi:hypothetical protein
MIPDNPPKPTGWDEHESRHVVEDEEERLRNTVVRHRTDRLQTEGFLVQSVGLSPVGDRQADEKRAVCHKRHPRVLVDAALSSMRRHRGTEVIDAQRAERDWLGPAALEQSEPVLRYCTMTSSIVLVTGANNGIGKEIARQLADARFTVYVGSRTVERGQRAVDEIGGDVHLLVIDVTDAVSIADAAARVEDLDVLVNKPASWSTASPRLRLMSTASLARTRRTCSG